MATTDVDENHWVGSVPLSGGGGLSSRSRANFSFSLFPKALIFFSSLISYFDKFNYHFRNSAKKWKSALRFLRDAYEYRLVPC